MGGTDGCGEGDAGARGGVEAIGQATGFVRAAFAVSILTQDWRNGRLMNRRTDGPLQAEALQGERANEATTHGAGGADLRCL